MVGLGLVLDYQPSMLWLGAFSEEILEHYEDAAYWFRKAAAFSNGIGMYRYGLLLLYGKAILNQGVSIKRCFVDATERGIEEAREILNTRWP
jgi:TPR repeat protein